ncbi:hypothetical protein WR25_26265 [Diploscapter pachys]|uniref:Uncharacterized protein n=1 Tax=Diploscapter pachys TaxID=2018661 RepID=A0A2A2JT86_9BILA|nr:hypothetical protein WR25_26265 [Diploscapter pachys]
MDVSFSSALAPSGSWRQRYKSAMNMIRRALSLRAEKRQQQRQQTTQRNNGHTQSARGVSASTSDLGLNDLKSRVSSLAGSEIASTSRDSVTFPVEAPSVYEDPFVAVTADGWVHVKHYHSFNKHAEFHMEDIHLPHVKKLCRSIRIARIIGIHYAKSDECRDWQKCKTWGISRNDVWWASHLNRTELANQLHSIVVDEGNTLKAGFSVINIDAFFECIQFLGLNGDVPINQGLPSPPIHLMQLPFIDEDNVTDDKASLEVNPDDSLPMDTSTTNSFQTARSPSPEIVVLSSGSLNSR